jgi:hypothetical protein
VEVQQCMQLTDTNRPIGLNLPPHQRSARDILLGELTASGLLEFILRHDRSSIPKSQHTVIQRQARRPQPCIRVSRIGLKQAEGR